MIEGVFGREAETVAFAFLAWRRRLPLWKHVLGNIWWRQATSRTVPSSSPWLLRCAFACCFRSNPMQHRHRLRLLRAHRKRRRRRQHPPPAAPIRPGQAVRGGRTMHASGNGEGAERWLDHLLRLSPWPDITATTNKQWA